ncbi:hypothetical protein [Paenibacillus contaminans]|uniref:Uncharacterized protein n=1 Tax=Paenibacillus contaminans TaxID=450362 RepID=A0A329MYI7_9BACL|nr:hypothetical protein [Paenibacillus contaminans]RAV22687.1 hypothetical protein DQG23_00250 [Paenibacillus contaminans]
MDINIYVVVGCVVAVLLAFGWVYFSKKYAPTIQNQMNTIKDAVKQKVGIGIYGEIEQAVVAGIHQAEEKFMGFVHDKYGINRHSFAKDVIRTVIKEFNLQDKITDDQIDLLIQFYVKALGFAKGENKDK